MIKVFRSNRVLTDATGVFLVSKHLAVNQRKFNLHVTFGFQMRNTGKDTEPLQELVLPYSYNVTILLPNNGLDT